MKLKMVSHKGFQDKTTLQLLTNQGPSFDRGEHMIRCISPDGMCSIYLTGAEFDSFEAQIEAAHADRPVSRT